MTGGGGLPRSVMNGGGPGVIDPGLNWDGSWVLADNAGVATDFKTILNLTVPLIVQIGHRKLPLSEILVLGPGSILELAKSADDPLDLQVNNKDIGTGTAVKVGENFGIRIAEINSARDRAEAMVGGS